MLLLVCFVLDLASPSPLSQALVPLEELADAMPLAAVQGFFTVDEERAAMDVAGDVNNVKAACAEAWEWQDQDAQPNDGYTVDKKPIGLGSPTNLSKCRCTHPGDHRGRGNALRGKHLVMSQTAAHHLQQRGQGCG